MILERKNTGSRSATVLVAVLVCLGVATTILLAAVQVSLGHRRQIRQELQMEQTKWLVDAGVRKALAEVEADEDYSGDIFSVVPLLKYDNAKLEIQVTLDEDESSALIKVSALVNRGKDEMTETNQTTELTIGR